MAKRNNIHVVPRTGGWAVRKESNVRASSVHETKREAIEAARKLAQRESGELIIHQSDGRISNRDSYSHDPLPPKRAPQVLFPASPASSSKGAIKKAVSEVARESHNGRHVDQRTVSRGKRRVVPAE